MRDTIELAREAKVTPDLVAAHGSYFTRIKHLVALARADEREACAKRRGVLAFCPYTGRPRHPSDIASDPHGLLILVPDQPLRGEKP